MKKAKKYFTVLTLLLAALTVALPASAQTLGGRRVTVNRTQAALEQILKDVKRQTGCMVFYNSQLLKGRRATVQAVNETVNKVLTQAFSGTGLQYTITDNTIVISAPKGHNQTITGGRRTVSGRIVDSQGAVLAGATVRVPGTAEGVITDSEGRFSLNVPAGVQQIDITFIGMKPLTLTLGHRSQYNVTMHEDSNMLDDVVATGYQTLSRERATGAYSQLKSDDISRRHATEFSTLLDGLIAGAQGTDDGRGGVSYQIRGTGTMVGDRTPLVVVDGFPLMDISSSAADMNPAISALEKINPADVESVTVLKDAAAASIWGARSANGVIVITTKKGKHKRLEVEVGTQLSVGAKQNMSQVLNVASAADMIRYQRLCFDRNWISNEYQGASIGQLTQPITASELLLYQGLRWGTITEDEMNSRLDQLAALSNRSQIKDNFFNNPAVWQTNASISGGTGGYSTYASIRYQHDTGDFIGSRQNSFMVNWNNSYDFNKYVTLTVDLGLQHENAHRSQISASDLQELSPYEMLFNADGSYAPQIRNYNTSVLDLFNWQDFTYHDMSYNMLQEARTRNQRTVNDSYRAQLGLKVNITEGLTFNSKFQYEMNRYKRRLYSSEQSFNTRMQVNYFTPCDYDGNVLDGAQSVLPAGGIVQPSDGRKTGVVFRNDLSFDHTFGNLHNVTAVLGSEVSNYRSSMFSRPYLYGSRDSRGTAGQVMDSEYYQTLEGSTSMIPGAAKDGHDYLSRTLNYNRYVSFYGNASYIFNDRYGLSLSARSDASNLITSEPKYRWSPLWSVGLLWNAHNEDFIKRAAFIDRLTLRATYGQNGNASTASSARTTINTNISSPDDATGIYYGEISDYGNPTLRWEKTATTNIGLDFAFFNNHLFGSVDYYDKRGTDILGTVTMSAVNGTSTATYNNAEMLNRGVELTLGATTDIGTVKLTGTLTYAYNKNRITRLYRELPTVSDVLNAEFVQGYPMGAIFTFRYAGMNEEGVPLIYNGTTGDNGHEGTTTIDDINIWYDGSPAMVKYQGTTVSPHTAGLSLNVEWAGFSLSALLNGRFGGKMRMPSFRYNDLSSYGKANYTAQLHDVLSGSSSMLPLPGEGVDSYVYSNWNLFYNCLDINIEDASYVYCREVVLNYTFPKLNGAQKLVKGLGLFCKVENLGLLWSANSKHYNPEYLPGTTAPTLTYTIGAKVSF